MPPPAVVVGSPGEGAGVGATVVFTVVSTVVVSDVVEVVVVFSSVESLPQADNNEATAIPEARANRAGFDAPREVIEAPLTRGCGD